MTMSAVLPDLKIAFSLPWSKARLGVASIGRYLRAEYDLRGLPGVGISCARLVGVLLSYGSHQKVVGALSSEQARLVGDCYPRLAYRYTLPYLSGDFGWTARRDMLLAHYEFFNQVLSVEFAARVAADTMVIWSTEIDGQQLSVNVAGLCPVTRHREGELTLRFDFNGRPLYNLSFSIVKSATIKRELKIRSGGSEHAFYLGRVQGAPGEMEAIRQVTALLGQVAPPDILMAALSGVAEALGVDTLVGVGSESCISSHTIKGSLSRFDYAEFWSRFGGQVIKGGHTHMALPIPERPIVEIPSKHRKRTLTKRAFKASVAARTKEAMLPMCQPGHLLGQRV
jgi:uncharacterized protein VirK/YbjX